MYISAISATHLYIQFGGTISQKFSVLKICQIPSFKSRGPPNKHLNVQWIQRGKCGHFNEPFQRGDHGDSNLARWTPRFDRKNHGYEISKFQGDRICIKKNHLCCFWDYGNLGSTMSSHFLIFNSCLNPSLSQPIQSYIVCFRQFLRVAIPSFVLIPKIHTFGEFPIHCQFFLHIDSIIFTG